MVLENKDYGLKFIEKWIATFPGKGYCHICKKKLGLFNNKVIHLHFGLSYTVCKSCYRKILIS